MRAPLLVALGLLSCQPPPSAPPSPPTAQKLRWERTSPPLDLTVLASELRWVDADSIEARGVEVDLTLHLGVDVPARLLADELTWTGERLTAQGVERLEALGLSLGGQRLETAWGEGASWRIQLSGEVSAVREGEELRVDLASWEGDRWRLASEGEESTCRVWRPGDVWPPHAGCEP